MFFNRRKNAPTEKRILLPQVTWPKLEILLAELGPTRAAQIAYDRGRLEMTTPLEEHERCARLIESLLLVMADETGSPLESLGSTLFLNADLGRAIQPNRCYSHHPIQPLGDRNELDLTHQAAPDLALDISLSTSTLNRFLIYAELGVPEIWEYRTTADEDVLRGQLTFHGWRGDRYLPLATSDWFPVLSSDRVVEFLDQSDKIGLVQALQVLRVWMKTALA
jgi:Uma2 family endonuclease